MVLVLLPCLAAADGPRVVVPVTATILPDNDIRYSVPVQIGDGPAIPALLDTGSTGLRVLAAALPAAGFTDTGFISLYAYGSGDRLAGTIGTATVAIGGVATDNAVPFEIVDQVGCMDFAPRCGAATLPPRDYGIGGDGIPEQGFQAILGVSLAPATGAGATANPLMHIGARRWIIELPEPGAAAGSLILNPDGDDLAGFQLFQLQALPPAAGGDGGWEDMLAGCLNDVSADQNICGPTVLDTGSPGIVAYRDGGPNATLWSPDDETNLAFLAPGSTAPTASVDFRADLFPGSGLIQAPAIGPAVLVGGVLPFFAYDVLYDDAAGTIGLRKRNDAPDMRNVQGGETAENEIEVIQMNTPQKAPPDADTSGVDTSAAPDLRLPNAPPASPMVLPQVIGP